MDEEINKRITQNLKNEIETCGKSKLEIAKAIGIAPATLSQYLSGRAQPRLATLIKLCEFIDCSFDDILKIK